MEGIRGFLGSDQPVKWLFYGDSITHGALHTFGARDYTELFAERVRFELGRSTDVVLNTATSGNTTRDLLKGFEWSVAQFRPQAVLLMIGMNDCSENRNVGLREFETNLLALAQRIEDLGALAILQTTCPILPGTAPDREPHFPHYMNAIRNAARDRSLPLIDHTRFWQRHQSSHFSWMDNGCHPNAHGHRAFALCLFQTLGIYDPRSQTCRLHVP